jgi:hypothetical protein
MAQPTMLPEHAQAVEHLPDHLPAIPPEVTLPNAAAADAIAAAAAHIASHVPEWFPLASAQIATAQDHPPTEIPPPPPHEVTLPAAAVEHLTQLPQTANIPDWFVL